ncbi:MAG: hypothetical protein HKN47_19195 [Pirellulaceae bacterium]|nr:hypothetical protein [Pirellulaceae bacterium]
MTGKALFACKVGRKSVVPRQFDLPVCEAFSGFMRVGSRGQLHASAVKIPPS